METHESRPVAKIDVAILLAAGGGRRMRGAVEDKILAPLAGRPVFAHSLLAFHRAGGFQRFTVVYRDGPQFEALERIAVDTLPPDFPVDWVAGGPRRQDSVRAALHVQPEHCAHVHIHDCARPLVHPDDIAALRRAAETHGAAALARPVSDTIKRLPSAGHTGPAPLEDLDRDRLRAMETPQAFRCDEIRRAHDLVHDRHLEVTDDIAALALLGGRHAALVTPAHPNPKLTHPSDLPWLEWLIRSRP